MSGHRVLQDIGKAPHEIPDPGNGAKLDKYIDRSELEIPLVIGSGSETNTVAAPTKAGLMLSISCSVCGGGSRAVTFTGQDFDGSSHSVMTFDAAAEWALFRSIKIAAATYCWKLVKSLGATAS